MVERFVLALLLLSVASLEVALSFTAEGISRSFESTRFEAATGRVAIFVEAPFEDEGRKLASDLQLPVVTKQSYEEVDDFQHVLRLLPFEVNGGDPTYVLSLETGGTTEACHTKSTNNERQRGSKSTKQKPFFVELCPSDSSRAGKRGTKEGGSDLLIKAVGPAKNVSDGRKGAVVYDLTAGLAQDSLVLALNGASEVHMVERNPIVAALLQDAIRRLKVLSSLQGLDNRAERALEVSRILNLHCGDSTEILKELLISERHPHPDVVYLDPMFPPRKKAAKVKKEMTILHSLLDTQSFSTVAEERRLQDELLLLEDSIKAAKSKVVVKRPAKAAPLGGDLSPFRVSYVIEGSVNRWDVYVK
jgi:16S rRNA (guanine1516-N2)-methyltransferase